jgi:hypothetical protein
MTIHLCTIAPSNSKTEPIEMTKQANKIKKRINGIEKQGQSIAPNKIAQLIAQRYPGIEFKPIQPS